jgi:hypothetical protein
VRRAGVLVAPAVVADDLLLRFLGEGQTASFNVTPQSKRAAGKHLRTAETAVSQKGSNSRLCPWTGLRARRGARWPPTSSPLRA